MRYLLREEELAPSRRAKDRWALGRYCRICAKRERDSLPANPETIRIFLADIFGQCSHSSLEEYVNAIRRWHLDRDYPDPFTSPMIQALLRASYRACRTIGTTLVAPTAICDVVDTIPHTIAGIRDTAMLLLSCCTRISARALSEAVRGDVLFAEPGMRVWIRYAYGARDIPVANYDDARYSPAAAMRRYLQLLNDDESSLFRTIDGDTITSRGLSRSAVAAILWRIVHGTNDPQMSLLALRARAIVSAANRRASDHDIMRQFGYTRTTPVRRWIDRLGNRRFDIIEKLGL